MIITLDNIIYAYNNCSNINETTKKIYRTYINKFNKWGINQINFESDDDLVNIFIDKGLNNNQIYVVLGLLRCTCKVCELSNDIKNIVYNLYHQYNKLSKEDQYNNRFVSKWTTDTLIQLNRTLKFDSYENMVTKLIIGLYTLIPPLRNDYYNVHIVHNQSVHIVYNNCENVNENYYNVDTGELSVYSNKSKKYHSVIVPVELKNIISESLVYKPREYLFVSLRGKLFLNPTDMYYRLMKHVRNVLGEDKFTINTFRHLYTQKSFQGSVEDRIAAQKGMLHNAYNHLRYGY